MKARTQAQTISVRFLGAVAIFACMVVLHPADASPQTENVGFKNVTAESGIDFVHENGASSEKYMPETMGGGALFLDFNNDNWPDVFLVNGGSFVDREAAVKARHRLYRNDGDGSFTDVTQDSGIGISGFGMGACSADFDNDGWADLYVTSFGENRLYRNTGNGKFVNVTAEAGVGSKSWSASCAFGDVDNDGYVDLYVTSYVDFSVENNRFCGLTGKYRMYCHPNVYKGQPDTFYHNNGNGTFSNATRESGLFRLDGNGLGVVFGDFDEDGWLDIYVANDSVPNFLFHNKGHGLFEEMGLLAGVAVSENGQPLAGMGTDSADIDGDGHLDLIVTNLDQESHNLYRNLGDLLFDDITFPSGVGPVTLPYVGFGTAFLDYDNDTDLDLAIVNGDVIDNVARTRDDTTYEQLNLLLQNDGSGRFTNVAPESGPGFQLKKSSRGLAVADIDNDGDLDLLIGAIGRRPDLLRNESSHRLNSVIVRTVGTTSNRDGIGARLTLFVDGKTLLRQVKAGSSYLGENDLRVHFGLGEAMRAERLEIRWPSGTVDVLENVDANQILTIKEGIGITESDPFTR